LALKDVDTSKFDRVAFIGGPGAKQLSDDADAQRVAREFNDANKVVGVGSTATLAERARRD